ncbi:hypothetical protein K2173_011479 [Erythroxylum novogranatense]|uniref:DUF761 domain-containing protein n=1 Tax=Erythroxylum novogranatense TaxID=1862640 RepID=A0AAV8TG60_9ROSI|nr:hypothetical protein K2173_011479 [Erythroxylum novogranatense]
MSRFRLPRKLQRAKMALKRFTSSFQSKLRSFSLSKTIKTNASRLLAYCSTHLLLHFNKRSITRPPHLHHPYRNFYQSHSNKSQLYNNFSAIYIDQLYASGSETRSTHTKQLHAHAESSNRGKAVVDEKAMPSRRGEPREKSLYSIEDAWREAVAKSPQLRPVDERAEEFIHKFHQDVKLQKERSTLEFEEMLARGA